MPILPSHTPVIRQLYLLSTRSLPQDQQAWVKLDVGPLLTEDTFLYTDLDVNSNVRFARWLARRIVEWNFTEADGTPVPINYDTISRLPKEDFDYLANQDLVKQPEGLPAEEKKS